MVPANSDRVSRAPPYSGFPPGPDSLRLRGYHPLRPRLPAVFGFAVRTPTGALLPRDGRNRPGLGYSPFARHYSGNHCCFLLLRLLRCFSSAGLPRACARWQAFRLPGCPIRTPADHRPFAPPRGFSQLVASFIASGSPGIPRAPLLTSPARSPAPAGPAPGHVSTYISLCLSLLLFTACHHVKERPIRGEYRSRTDDPLLAKQVL